MILPWYGGYGSHTAKGQQLRAIRRTCKRRRKERRATRRTRGTRGQGLSGGRRGLGKKPAYADVRVEVDY